MFILTAVTRHLAIARFLFGYSGPFWGMFSKIRLDIIKSFISSLPIAVACLINSNCYFCLETLLLTQWWKKNTKSRKDNSVENKPTRWRFLLEPGKDKDSTGSVTERCPKSFISSLPIAVACLINSNCYFCLETLLLTQWWKKNTKSRKDNSVENKPTRWRFLLEPGKDKDSTGSVTERCPYCPPFNNGHVPHKRPHKICERCSFFNLEETLFLILS